MRVFWLLVFLLVPVLAEAQAITAIQLTFYRQGTQAMTPFEIPLSAMTCGQTRTAPPTGTVLNPNTYRFNDPNAPTLDCVYSEPAGGPLFMLELDAAVSYTARGRLRNSAGLGPEGPDSNPFSRPGSAPTATPAGLRIVRVGS